MADRLERVADEQVVDAAHAAATRAVPTGEGVDGTRAPRLGLVRIPEEDRRCPRCGERGEGSRVDPASAGIPLRRLSGSNDGCQNPLPVESPVMLTPRIATTKIT